LSLTAILKVVSLMVVLFVLSTMERDLWGLCERGVLRDKEALSVSVGY
jgi:hypothetical protein